MAKMIISIRTQNLSLVKFYLEKKYTEDECFENVFIRYGNDTNFLPCSAIEQDGYILLHKAGIGQIGDVKVTAKDWLKALRAMGSKEIFNKWNELIKNKEAA
jgi:hypothetical protein